MIRSFREFVKKINQRKPKWINLRNFIFVIVIFAFIVIVIWSESLSVYFQGNIDPQPGVVEITPTTLPGTPTPLPEEYLSSAQQTNGVVSGALIILIAILAGTAAILIRDREK